MYLLVTYCSTLPFISWCALCARGATSDCSLIDYKTGGGGFGKNYDFQGGSPPPPPFWDGKRSKNFWIRSEKYIVKIWNIAICLLHPCKPVTSELVSQAKHNTFLDNLNRLSYLWWRKVISEVYISFVLQCTVSGR